MTFWSRMREVFWRIISRKLSEVFYRPGHNFIRAKFFRGTIAFFSSDSEFMSIFSSFTTSSLQTDRLSAQRNILYPIHPNHCELAREFTRPRARALLHYSRWSLSSSGARWHQGQAASKISRSSRTLSSPRRREREENARGEKRAWPGSIASRVHPIAWSFRKPQVLRSPPQAIPCSPSSSSQDSRVSLRSPPSPLRRHLPPTFAGSLTWPVASSCTPGEDFLRKTANYISEMHAVWSTLDEIARVRRAGHVEPPRPDCFCFLSQVSPRIHVTVASERRGGETAPVRTERKFVHVTRRRGTPQRTSREAPNPGDHEAREKLGPFGSDRADRDGSAAEAHPRWG